MTHIALSGMSTPVTTSSSVTNMPHTVAHHDGDPMGPRQPVIGDKSALLSPLDNSDYSECTQHVTPVPSPVSHITASSSNTAFVHRVPCFNCKKRYLEKPAYGKAICEYCQVDLAKMFDEQDACVPAPAIYLLPSGPDQPSPVVQRGVLTLSPTSRDLVPALGGVGSRPPNNVEDLGVAHQPVFGTSTCRAAM